MVLLNFQKILYSLDHTALSQTVSEKDIVKLCGEGLQYGVAAACVPPAYVKISKNYVKNNLKICTVIGFPNGNTTTLTKCFEADDALKNGADEIDMVINLGWLKNKQYTEVFDEIAKIREICKNKILKVIVEACLLDNSEKIEICKIITEANADYIKTSTGFSISGATFEDIKLFLKYIGKNVKIKAAGGINSLETAEKFIEIGVDRIGSSKILHLIQKQNANLWV
jgi:deoxyribose-phosphate aldolase